MVPGRVLLVDDDPSILRMLKTVLQRSGFATEEARDGEGAMALLSEQAFNVVISDVNMPGGGGMEFLRSVREKNFELPVIMITGRPTVETTTKALEFGVFRYLLKPVSPKALTDAVERALSEYRATESKRGALQIEEAKLLGDVADLGERFDAALSKMWMAFQPIVEPRSGTTYGYEALLRSDEPSLANPSAILCAGKRLGRIPEVGQRVRKVLGATVLPDGCALFMNLHPSDLLDEDLYSLNAALTRNAWRVVLELSERAAFDDIPDLPARIVRLRRLGFRIAMDDLGSARTGSTFKRLNPDIVKLDPELVRDIHREPRKQSIVRSICTLGGDIGICIVAEAVEQAEERDMLLALGCHMMQGYLYGRPSRALRG